MTEQSVPEAVASTPRSKRTGLIITFAVILALLAWGLRKVQAATGARPGVAGFPL